MDYGVGQKAGFCGSRSSWDPPIICPLSPARWLASAWSGSLNMSLSVSRLVFYWLSPVCMHGIQLKESSRVTFWCAHPPHPTNVQFRKEFFCEFSLISYSPCVHCEVNLSTLVSLVRALRLGGHSQSFQNEQRATSSLTLCNSCLSISPPPLWFLVIFLGNLEG